MSLWLPCGSRQWLIVRRGSHSGFNVFDVIYSNLSHRGFSQKHLQHAGSSASSPFLAPLRSWLHLGSVALRCSSLPARDFLDLFPLIHDATTPISKPDTRLCDLGEIRIFTATVDPTEGCIYPAELPQFFINCGSKKFVGPCHRRRRRLREEEKMDPPDDDARHAELETLEAIYPEIRRSEDGHGPFTFDIELPVAPAAPVTVTFPAALGNGPPGLGADGQPVGHGHGHRHGLGDADSLQVSHLPPVSLRITLPNGYPSDRPPLVKVSTNPPWLSPETLARLEDDGPRLWEEAGCDMVAYTYIDHVQRAADDVFGTITADGSLQVDAQHKLAVLDYDIKAKKVAFEKETFDCGVCLGKCFLKQIWHLRTPC
jgi:hypothetical protein